jgi:hypothetical protein
LCSRRNRNLPAASVHGEIFERLAQLGLAVFVNERLPRLGFGALHFEPARESRTSAACDSVPTTRSNIRPPAGVPAASDSRDRDLLFFASAIAFDGAGFEFEIRDREFQLFGAAVHFGEIHAVTLHARGEVREFAFDATQFGGRAATSFGGSGGGARWPASDSLSTSASRRRSVNSAEARITLSAADSRAASAVSASTNAR